MAGAYSLKALTKRTGDLAAAMARFLSMQTSNVADLSITDTHQGLEWQAPTLHESPQEDWRDKGTYRQMATEIVLWSHLCMLEGGGPKGLWVALLLGSRGGTQGVNPATLRLVR